MWRASRDKANPPGSRARVEAGVPKFDPLHINAKRSLAVPLHLTVRAHPAHVELRTAGEPVRHRSGSRNRLWSPREDGLALARSGPGDSVRAPGLWPAFVSRLRGSSTDQRDESPIVLQRDVSGESAPKGQGDYQSALPPLADAERSCDESPAYEVGGHPLTALSMRA